MTSSEHFEAAERELALAEDSKLLPLERQLYLGAAQVHATLAQTADTANALNDIARALLKPRA